jgi:ATP-dependent Zn protease
VCLPHTLSSMSLLKFQAKDKLLSSLPKKITRNETVVPSVLKFLGIGVFYVLFVYFAARIYSRTITYDDQNYLIKKRKYEKKDTYDFRNFWAGEIPKDAEEIIDLLKYRHTYAYFGSEMPKGILLHGPPGTGKTYFARIIASITNSKFLYASASQFDEIFVGRGAQRVRDLFEEAMKRSQRNDGIFSRVFGIFFKRHDNEADSEKETTIVFIDEIDALGNRKDVLQARDNQTLSQLLTCMDGLMEMKNVLVLAATNNLANVDPALLRSGRFDRIVKMSLPNKRSREEILTFYMRGKPGFKQLVDRGVIAQLAHFTKGFNCADLKNLANEAALRATREVIAKQKRQQSHNTANRNPMSAEEPESGLLEFSSDGNQGDMLPVIEEKHIQEAFLALYNKIKQENRSKSLLDNKTIERFVNAKPQTDD